MKGSFSSIGYETSEKKGERHSLPAGVAGAGMTNMEDAEIIRLYWLRNETAIAESEKAYGAYCFTVANNLLDSPPDAEECVNDTWLKAWGAIPPARPKYLRLFFGRPPKRPSVLSAFLGKITRNLAFDRWRHDGCAKRGGGEVELVLDELTECVSDTESPEDVLQNNALRESLNRFLNRLSPREHRIFLRRYFYAESVKAIADRYDLRESNVLSILSRTRKKLKEHLQKEGFEL